VVFAHDDDCADCDYGKGGVLRYSGYELRRLDAKARWPRLPAPHAQTQAIDDESLKPQKCPPHAATATRGSE
jgi:hypothetical protein